jgi:import inner membrane translocase subunit TIM22
MSASGPAVPADQPTGTPLVSPSSFKAINSPEAKAAAVATVTDAMSTGANVSESDAVYQQAFRDFIAQRRFFGMNPPPPQPLRVGESCASKMLISTVMGGSMGVAVGLVFGAMNTSNTSMLIPGVPEPPRKTLRHEFRDSIRQTRFKARSWARNFAFISGVYSGVECAVEKVRGRHDVINAVSAGCITGAGLAMGSGPQVRGPRTVWRWVAVVVLLLLRLLPLLCRCPPSAMLLTDRSP